MAELLPIAGSPRIRAVKKLRIFDAMQKIGARIPQVDDSAQIIEEDRDR